MPTPPLDPALLAANPITIGELTDVPAPQSPVNAQFHQEVANRIIHRFPNVAAMNAWAAANGSMAFAVDVAAHYRRTAGAWQRIATQADIDSINSGLGNTNSLLATAPLGLLAVTYAGFVDFSTSSTVLASVSWTADPSRWYRIVADIPRVNSGANPQDVTFVIEDNAGTDYRLALHRFTGATQMYAPTHMHLLRSGLSGAQTWRIAGNTSTANAQIPSGLNNASNAMISVEDMGAV
jgi:hypothetical protein